MSALASLPRARHAALAYLVAPLLLCVPLAAQPGGTATSTALIVNKETGAITGPVSAATFASANSLGGGGGGGSGTVTSFSAGDLSPLFTTSEANATSTPALSFSLSTAAQNAVFAGPATGGTGAPSYRSLVAADIPSLTFSKISDPGQLVTWKDVTPSANGQSFVAAADYAAMRSLLSLGDAATKNTGTSAGTVAAGDDSRITGAAQASALIAVNGSGINVGGLVDWSQLMNVPAGFADGSDDGSGGGSGTVTSFSAGDLSPLFTTSEANVTSTPALTFSLSTAAQNAVFAGPATGGTGAPSYRSLVAADIPSLLLSKISDAGQLVTWKDVTPSANGQSFVAAADYAAMRTLLGLNGAALLNVGTTAGTVAAGDDSRFTDTRTPTDGSVTTTKVQAATLVIASEGISSNNNDTTIPTSAAVKAYADSVVGGGIGGNFSASGNTISSSGNFTLTSGTDENIVLDPGGSGEVRVVGSANITGNLTLGGTGNFVTLNATTFNPTTVAGATAHGQIWIGNVTNGLFTKAVLTAGDGIAITNAAGAITINATGGGSGDVTAAASFSNDNRLIRSDGTGKGVQASNIVLDDSGNITSGLNNVVIDGISTFNGASVIPAAALGSTAINVAEIAQVRTLTANETWTLSATPSDETYFGVKVRSPTTGYTATLPAGTWVAVGSDGTLTSITAVAVPADGLVDLTVRYDTDTTTYYVYGYPTSGGSGVSDGDKGDITISSSGTAYTIDNGAVSLAKMANLAQDQFIGRTTGSTGVPETATITAAARSVLDDTTVGAMVNTLGGATTQGTGGLVREAAPTISAPVFTGVVTRSGASIVTPTAMGALAVDTSKPNSKTISGDATFTFSGAPAANTHFNAEVTNSDGSDHTLTIPSSVPWGASAAITTVTVPASATINVLWYYTGSVYRVAVLTVASAGSVAVGDITGLGTGVPAALAIDVGSAGAPVLFNGAGGTPSSMTGTNITGTAAGLTAGTASAVAVGGITGLGTGVATALAVNVGSAGAPVVFNGAGGTPSSMTGTNITGTAAGLTAGAASAVAVGGITGLGTGVGTALAINVGSAGAPVVLDGAGGTPSAITLTNGVGLPVSGITNSTSTGIGFGSIELGHASDTTIARVSAGVISVEGVTVAMVAGNIGAATATSPSANDDDTSVATTEFVQDELTAYASDTVTFTNKKVSVSAALGSDDTYNASEEIAGLNAGATIAQWEAVYVGGSSTYLLADADGSGTYPAIGLAVAAYSNTNAAVVVTSGTVRNDAWSWTPGGIIYLSTTAGGLTQTAPNATGDKVQVIGRALTADIMHVNPSADYGTAP